MKYLIIGFFLISTIMGCGGTKPQPQISSPEISGRTYSDANIPDLTVTFPFNIYSHAKPKVESVNNNIIHIQTLLTDDLSTTVYINTMSLSSQAYAAADETASDISKPIYIDKKESGYCVLFQEYDFSSSTFESRIFKKNEGNQVILMRVVKKLYDSKPDAALTNKYTDYTKQLCSQLF